MNRLRRRCCNVCVATALESATVSESATAAMLQRANAFVTMELEYLTVSETAASAMLQHLYVCVAMACESATAAMLQHAVVFVAIACESVTGSESAVDILKELDIKCSDRRTLSHCG